MSRWGRKKLKTEIKCTIATCTESIKGGKTEGKKNAKENFPCKNLLNYAKANKGHQYSYPVQNNFTKP